ncbi:MAG: twin-arginine translocation signal domain-containing protein [Candidatus Binatia bacterium]
MNQTSTDAQNEAPATVRTRRNFLRDLTLGSVAAAAAVTVVVPKAEAADPVPTTDHTGDVKIFRFSTRNNVSCRACRNHHRYMAFRTRKAARMNRAHPGCDCRIEPQWVERKTFRQLFKANGVKVDVANLKPGPRF